ncbi:MAG: NDP-sugar synthase [Phycisphaerae bacterium]|nr:NDP-sugar synthase [Phycisphaerae bacterium]
MSNLNIKAIILAGGLDFGRCRIASRLPAALWPIAGKPVIVRLLNHLAEQGVKQATICFDGDQKIFRKELDLLEGIAIDYLTETMPLGTAGCLRDSVNGNPEAKYYVCKANMTSPPDVNELYAEHCQANAMMTVALDHDPAGVHRAIEVAGAYLFEPDILSLIPETGYCDIKEKLIPTMVKANQKVHAVKMTHSVGAFRDWSSYLDAVADTLMNGFRHDFVKSQKDQPDSDRWISEKAQVDSTARLFGPVVVLEGAKISENAVIFGPTIIGKDVIIGRNSLVENSVLWDRACIGRDCEVQHCLLDYDAILADHKKLNNLMWH